MFFVFQYNTFIAKCQREITACDKQQRLWLHHLDKAEHFIRAFVGITFLVIHTLVCGLKILAPELIDMKAALIDIEVDIALFIDCRE